MSPIFPYQEHLAGQRVAGKYRVGGIGQYIYFVTAELDRLGHQVTVIAPRAPKDRNLTEVELKNGRIRRVSPLFSIYSGSVPLGILKALDPADFDVIHAHVPMPTIAELAALRNLLSKRPFVLTYHNDVAGGSFWSRAVAAAYGLTLGPFLLGRADAIITTTWSYALNSRRLSRYLHKVRVAPCMVDVDRFHPGLAGDRIREKHGLGPENKVVLFVGGLLPYKGVEYLIRAMSKVVSLIPQAKLVIAGKGRCEDSLRAEVHQQGIEGSVVFAGFVPDEDLPHYYAASDVFALPSVSSEEGFGIVQLEALACGKPVVTTSLPGVGEVDTEEVASIHVPPRDAGALANALVRILGNSEMAVSLGRRGRELCERKYTVAKVTQRLLEIYSQVMETKGRPAIREDRCVSA